MIAKIKYREIKKENHSEFWQGFVEHIDTSQLWPFDSFVIFLVSHESSARI